MAEGYMSAANISGGFHQLCDWLMFDDFPTWWQASTNHRQPF